MPRLGTRPAAEVAIDGEKLNLREAARILRRDLRIARTIIVACDDFLRLGRVQKLEIGFRHRQRSIFPGIAVHHRNRKNGPLAESEASVPFFRPSPFTTAAGGLARIENDGVTMANFPQPDPRRTSLASIPQ